MNLKPNQNLRKESVKYKSNKKYKYLLFSGLALCSLSLEAKLNNDQVKAESEKAQTSTKLEKDPLTGFSNTKILFSMIILYYKYYKKIQEIHLLTIVWLQLIKIILLLILCLMVMLNGLLRIIVEYYF